jgi:hypothetical protein
LKERGEQELRERALVRDREGRESAQAKVRAADPFNEPTNMRVVPGIGLVGPSHPRYDEGLRIGGGPDPKP